MQSGVQYEEMQHSVAGGTWSQCQSKRSAKYEPKKGTNIHADHCILYYHVFLVFRQCYSTRSLNGTLLPEPVIIVSKGHIVGVEAICPLNVRFSWMPFPRDVREQ
jgi:hypothetical protein